MSKIRSYCKKIGFEVAGKITYFGKRDMLHRVYMDEARTQYWISESTGDVYVLPAKPMDKKE